MLKIWAITILVATCYVHGEPLNEKWKRNDKIIKSYDSMYKNLARTIEDNENKQKRCYSIALTGVLRIILSSGNDDPPTIDITETSDVIAMETVDAIDLERVVLDPVINLVKRACPPSATKTECRKALAEEQEKATEMCSGFQASLRFYRDTEEMFNDKGFQKLLYEILEFSNVCKDDSAALKFVDDLESGKKFKTVISKMTEWYTAYLAREYTCNLPPVKCEADS